VDHRGVVAVVSAAVRVTQVVPAPVPARVHDGRPGRERRDLIGPSAPHVAPSASNRTHAHTATAQV
jgi:hypothetical protein